MITNLVGQKTLKLIDKGIKKNKVKFKFYEDTVTLVSHPKYYGIHLARQQNSKTTTPEACSELREMVESTLTTVTSQTNYGYRPRFEPAFECPSHPGRDHLCIVKCEAPETMHCLVDRKKPDAHKMEDKHLVWFGKVREQYNIFRYCCKFISNLQPFYCVKSDIHGCTSKLHCSSYVHVLLIVVTNFSSLGYTDFFVLTKSHN